jgi:Asp-tRNA(Asn)/Glu-tRNA(Gln) amidotransferase C subunit
MKTSIFTLIAILLSVNVSAEITDFQDYRNKALTLFKQLQDKNTNNLEENAKVLVNTSKAIVIKSISTLPQCDEYLSALLNVANHIATLPIEEIESGYHADGKLPALKDGSCYHAKDLLVHPATVQAMAHNGIKSESEWKQAAHEIEEVLEHLSVVESVYASN